MIGLYTQVDIARMRSRLNISTLSLSLDTLLTIQLFLFFLLFISSFNTALCSVYLVVFITKWNADHLLSVFDPLSEVKEVVKESKNALERAGHVGSKLQRRMYSRAMRNLQNVKVRSTETLNKLNFTVDLVRSSFMNENG